MSHANITVYGTTWCGDCKRTKQFLGQQRVPYDWVDVEQDADGMAFIERVQNGGHTVPTVVFGDGSMLMEPTNAQVAAKLGLSTRAASTFYDVIIAGGGPAGLSAALYAAREGFTTLVIEGMGLGGQVAITERLDNYPGFPEGVSGAEFAERLIAQARRFQVETISAQRVVGLGESTQYRVVRTEDGSEYTGRSVLIATGSKYRRLGVPGEDELIGAGVHYCATCDGPFYRGKDVVVIGGGNSAVEEGMFLTRFAQNVTVLVRGDTLKASQVAVEKFKDHPGIQAVYNTEVVEFTGNGHLSSVRVRDHVTGETRLMDPNPAGAFVFVGLKPNTGFLPPEVELDVRGFVVTSPTLETTLRGVFAAGDVRSGSTKQAASAAGEGATAALAIRDFLRLVG